MCLKSMDVDIDWWWCPFDGGDILLSGGLQCSDAHWLIESVWGLDLRVTSEFIEQVFRWYARVAASVFSISAGN